MPADLEMVGVGVDQTRRAADSATAALMMALRLSSLLRLAMSLGGMMG